MLPLNIIWPETNTHPHHPSNQASISSSIKADLWISTSPSFNTTLNYVFFQCIPLLNHSSNHVIFITLKQSIGFIFPYPFLHRVSSQKRLKSNLLQLSHNMFCKNIARLARPWHQLSWAIKHPFVSLSFKYHSPGLLRFSTKLAPVISSLDEIYSKIWTDFP